MRLGDGLAGAARTYIERPADVLPFYFLAAAVPAIARSVPAIGLFIALFVLARNGGVEQIATELEAVGPIHIDDPEALDMEPDPAVLEEISAFVAIPEVLGLIALSVVVGAVLLLVLNAAVTAGQIHAVYASTRGRAGVRAGVDGVFAHTATFLGLIVLELALYTVIVGGGLLVVGLGAAVAMPLGVILGLIVALVLLVAVPAIRLLFAFAPVVAVIEDCGLAPALSGTVQYGKRQSEAVIGYGLVVFALFVAGGLVGAIVAAIGAGAVGTLVILFVVFPLLDLFKVILVASDHTAGRLAVPKTVTAGVVQITRRGLGRGWAELRSFTRAVLPLVGVSAIILGGFGWVGWTVTAPFEGLLIASIEERLADTIPIGDFGEYAAHNWQVAIGQAFSGIGLAIPTIVSLAINGLFFGALFRLEAAPDILIAFVIPHGLVEIPALLISGALGLYLGIVSWQFVRGAADRRTLTDAIERAYGVMIGLAILFVVAAAVEAFVSPYYWRVIGV